VRRSVTLRAPDALARSAGEHVVRSTRERMRRGRAGGVALVSLALLVASCLPEDAGTARPPDREPVRVDESLGVVRVAAGAPLRLGVVLDLTGGPEGDAAAAALAAAMQVAIEDFGAVQGFRVQLADTIDGRCTQAGGTEAGTRLATDPSVVAVLGAQCDETLAGLQGPLSDAGLTLVTPRARALGFTEDPPGAPGSDRNEGVWRVAPSLAADARAAAAWAATELELQRGAVVTDGSLQATGLATAFQVAYESLGGTVLTSQVLGADEGSERVLAALAEVTPEFVLLVLDPARLLVLTDDWDGVARLRSAIRAVPSSSVTAELLGEPAAEGLRLIWPWQDLDAASSAVTGMNASHVLERLDAGFGIVPTDGWWAAAYDAMTLLLRAIDDVSLVDVDGSLVISRSDLRAGVGRSVFRGMTGTIACGPFGDCSSDRMNVHLYDDASVSDVRTLPRLWTFEPER
jgi:ABC-type branched-subunit amino acid transport system substrate-binding protein